MNPRPADSSILRNIAVAAVCAAALWLAFGHINAPLLADDVWSLRTVQLPWMAMLNALRIDVHPPLYFAALAGWVRIAGDSELSLRLLSVAFYLLSIAAMFRLCRRHQGVDAAILSTAIYAVTPLAVLGASLVRMYSLLSLLAILSTHAWLDICMDGPQRRRRLVWVTVNVLGTFCHLWFFCLLAGQALTSLILYRPRWRPLCTGFVLSIAPYGVLWLPALLSQMQGANEAAAWLEAPGRGIVPEILIMQVGLMTLVVPVLLFRAWEERCWEFGVPAWTGLTLVFTLLPPLLVSFVKPFFHVRFTIVVTHILAFILGAMVARYFDAKLAAALAALAVAFSVGMYGRGAECDSRVFAGRLAAKVRDGDVVIYSSLSRPPLDHYLDRIKPERRWMETSFPPEIDAHPGYEGSLAVKAERRGELARVAQDLVLQIGARRGAQVYFLHGVRPETDKVLVDALKSRFASAPNAAPACPGGGAYFSEVSAFVVPDTR